MNSTHHKRVEIRNKIHEYCFNERAGQGCLGCPLDNLDICCRDIIHEIDIRRLLKVAGKIDELTKGAKQ